MYLVVLLCYSWHGRDRNMLEAPYRLKNNLFKDNKVPNYHCSYKLILKYKIYLPYNWDQSVFLSH